MAAKKGKSIYKSISEQARKNVSANEVRDKIRMDEMIRSMRLARGLSGAELCRRAGDMDPKTLTAIEKGRIKNPSMQTLQSLARGLGTTVSEIFRFHEQDQERHLYVGGQKGAFVIDFPKRGVKIVSFTPLVPNFFCGKVTLSAQVKVSETLLNQPVPVFVSVLVGKLNVEMESEVHKLQEGENIFFNGAWKHGFLNPGHRETSFLMVMAPSFLKSGV